MRNFVIAFSVFLAFVFIMALAIGQGDESVTDLGYADDLEQVDNFLSTEEEYIEPEIAEPEVQIEVAEESEPEPETEPVNTAHLFDNSAIEIPKATVVFPEQILVREGYTTSYNKETKCAKWVAWKLTKEHTYGDYHRSGVPYYDENYKVIGIGKVNENVVRNSYIVDKEAGPPRQEFSDWYDAPANTDHGHICPAADNKWSKAAINQSFLLTNMCPQDHDLNGGDWATLEDRCRGWARRYGEIYIAAGPVFFNGITKTMGANKVGVPDAFYKVVLYLGKSPKALGFIFPNNGTHHRLEEYLLSVDEVEQVTGFDFFHNLPDDVENIIEAQSDLKLW